MKNLNKKAVSGVIVTVLLVLLVFAAVAIVWAVIQPFISGGLQDVEGQAACLKLDMEIESATYSADLQEKTTVKITRTAGNANVTEMRIFAEGTQKFPTNSKIPNVPGASVSYVIWEDLSNQAITATPVLVDGTVCNEIGPVTVG